MTKGGIHIKKKNIGSFTEYCGGQVTEECISRGKNSPSAAIRKKATFAKNARSWHHEDGGVLYAQEGATVNLKYFKNPNIKFQGSELPKDKDEDEKTTSTKITSTSTSTEPDEDWTTQYIRNYTGMSGTTVQQDSTTGIYSTTSVSAPSSAKDAMSYLMSKGLSKEAAAGVVGVFTAESGLRAGIVNKEEDKLYGSTAGRGLGQWSNERRKQYDDYMKDKDVSLQADLDFFLADLESRPLVKQALQNATSVDDAVRAMHLGYENGSVGAMATPEQLTSTYTRAWAKAGYGPYNYEKSHGKRLNYAQSAYQSI